MYRWDPRRWDPRLLSLTDEQIKEKVLGLLELRDYRRAGANFLERFREVRDGRGQPPASQRWEAPGLLNLACLVELAYMKARARKQAGRSERPRRGRRDDHPPESRAELDFLAERFLKTWHVWDELPSGRTLVNYRRAFSGGVSFRDFFEWLLLPPDPASQNKPASFPLDAFDE